METQVVSGSVNHPVISAPATTECDNATELFLTPGAPGERKQEVLSDLLSAWAWVPCSPHYLVGNEDAWVKGNLMLLVDTVGVMIYRKRGRSWQRVGGIGYLSMTGFPVVKYQRSNYELDFEAGKAQRIG